MSNDQGNGNDQEQDKSDLIQGQVRHNQLSARVPEHVARGVFSTGAIVLVGNNEFIMDFVVRMAQPHQVATRVTSPHAVMTQLIGAIKTNLAKYRDRFGDLPEMPKGDPSAHRPTIDEVYDELKLPDEQLSGVYANAVMISHSPAEFCFDFITHFYPKSSVSGRVYVSAAQVPRLLDAISHTYEEFKKRVIAQQSQQRQQQIARQNVPTESPPESPPESPYYPPKVINPSEVNEQIVGPPQWEGEDNEIITGPSDVVDAGGDAGEAGDAGDSEDNSGTGGGSGGGTGGGSGGGSGSEPGGDLLDDPQSN